MKRGDAESSWQNFYQRKKYDTTLSRGAAHSKNRGTLSSLLFSTLEEKTIRGKKRPHPIKTALGPVFGKSKEIKRKGGLPSSTRWEDSP